MAGIAACAVCLSGSAFAAEEGSALLSVNNLWILIAAAMVFMMHLGFASLESGLTRAKNTVNILFKNTAIVALGLLTYTLIGWSLMFPGESFAGGYVGFAGLGIDLGEMTKVVDGAYVNWTMFIFQAMFAATAATIVSGAVAERIKLGSFLVFSALYVAILYPICGFWIWGNGWLSSRATPFTDFAGSTAVHSVGGWAALAGIIVLGPRIGKYGADRKSRPIPGHSMPLAAIGVFLLWFGWYGFNGGSVLNAEPEGLARVFVTTSLGAAAGVFMAMITDWLVNRKPDLSMVLNGALAGLVGITASADLITPVGAIIVGGIAGMLVVFSVLFIDGKLHLDDPVGATSVHLVCGIWGTLATGLFAAEGVLTAGEASSGLFYGGGSALLVSQILGVVAVGAVCFVGAFVLFKIVDAVLGLRVSPSEERGGLDIGEHGMEAYAGFQIFVTQ